MNEFDSPQSSVEAALQNMLGAENELDPARSRIEKILHKMLGYDVDLEPSQSRIEELLIQLYEQGGSGGSSVTVEPLTVTQNGTQTAPTGKAYSPVTVNVPNSYTDSDIWKVVDAAKQLVAQRDYFVNLNGTYDTTYNNSVTVNVEPVPVYIDDFSEGGTATLANPFPNLDFTALKDALDPSNAKLNAFIGFQFQGMNGLFHPFADNGAIVAMAFLPDDGQGNPIGAYAQWNSYGNLSSLYVLSGGQMQDLSSIAANIPCVTLIYGTTDPTPAA